MQGNDLARSLLISWPDLPVLYMSGYSRSAIVHAGRLDEGVNYLEKPFTPDSLAAKVREVLADTAEGGYSRCAHALCTEYGVARLSGNTPQPSPLHRLFEPPPTLSATACALRGGAS